MASFLKKIYTLFKDRSCFPKKVQIQVKRTDKGTKYRSLDDGWVRYISRKQDLLLFLSWFLSTLS